MPDDTKICDSCDTVIGRNEKTCPKCKVDFEELEDAVATVSKAQEVIEKRRKAAEPKPCEKCKTIHKEEEACPAPAPAAKKNPLRGLGKVLRSKNA
jgi:hypothetical protein